MPCVEEGPQGLPGDQTGGSQRDGCSVPVTYGHRRMASGQRIKPILYKKWARKVGLSPGVQGGSRSRRCRGRRESFQDLLGEMRVKVWVW